MYDTETCIFKGLRELDLGTHAAQTLLSRRGDIRLVTPSLPMDPGSSLWDASIN